MVSPLPGAQQTKTSRAESKPTNGHSGEPFNSPMLHRTVSLRPNASTGRPLEGAALPLYRMLLPALVLGVLSIQTIAADPQAQTSGTAKTSGTAAKTSGTTATEVEEVVVTGITKDGSQDVGYRTDYVSMGPLGSTSVLDVPYSITSVSSDLIANTQAQSVAAALQYVPTVQSQTGGSRLTDYYTIRGFSSSVWTYNTSIDGLRCYDAVVPIEDKERIEVLNGANSFLFGITSPAGMINYVAKRPTSYDLYDITIGNYGGDQYYTHIDLGGPLDKAGKVSYRLNLAGVAPGEVGVDDEKNGRFLASGAVDWHITPDMVWSVNASYFKRHLEDNQPLFMIGKATEVPSAPDTSKNYSPDYSYGKDEIKKIGTDFVYKISDTFNLRSAFQYTDQQRSYATFREVWQNNAGDYTIRTDYAGQNITTTTQGYVYLDSVFETGPFSHKVTVGVSDDYIEILTPYPNGLKSVTGKTVYASNLKNAKTPVELAHVLSSGSPYRKTEESNFNSVLLADQIDITKQWSVMLGGNYSSVDTRTWSSSTWLENPENDKGEATPSVALMYKPTDKVTTYVSYIQALQRGDTAPATADNAYEVLSPYKSNQYELGVKSEIYGVNLNAALFRVDQPYAYTNTTTNIYSDDGREVHTGVELSASGKLTRDLTFFGGFTFMDPTVEKASTSSLDGKAPQGVAKEMAKLYLEYAVPYVTGFALTGGINYIGREWVDAANTISIPSVTLGNIGARYQRKFWSHEFTFRVNVDNVTGRNYWTTRSGILYLGNPRTVSFSAEMKF
jgi:iron complex outermembrane recepter protein